MAERPKVEIFFKQMASTLIKRSGEFPVVLLLTRCDGTYGKELNLQGMFKELNYLSDISESDLEGYTCEPKTTYNAIKYCFANNPKKVILSNYKWSVTWQKLKEKGLTNCIIAKADINSDGVEELTTYITSLANNEGHGCCFVSCGDNTSNIPYLRDMHYIQIAKSVDYYGTDGRELSDYEKNALYAGAIAACGCDRSLTNYTLPLISSVEYRENATGIDFTARGLISAEIMNGAVRVVAGVNTAEVSDEVTEDMQHIEVVQTMDMIRKDISDTFAEYYRGAYKNNYNRQLLFIAAIKGYFTDLAGEEVLDPNFDNTCDVYVEAQRNAWLGYGKEEAESWSDDKVKLMSFGRKLFLTADIKICQSMEDLTMYIILE